MIQLNVDTDATIIFTNKLEKLNRSAFPNAVRTALNSAAFDVKKDELLRSTERHFNKRQPNFFRANSRVEMATGWNLDEMKARVGMVDLGGNNYAVDDLEQQEHGGIIGGKSFIPLNSARSSKNYSKNVQKRNRISAINGIKNVDAVSSRSGNKYIFRRYAHKVGVGGHLIYKGILWRIESLAGRDIKMTGLHTFLSGRKVKVKKATHFMREASNQSAKKIDRFYIQAAEKQFEKALR